MQTSKEAGLRLYRGHFEYEEKRKKKLKEQALSSKRNMALKLTSKARRIKDRNFNTLYELASQKSLKSKPSINRFQ